MKKIFLTAVMILALSAPLFASAQGLKDAGKLLDQAANTSKTGLSGDLSGTIASVIKAVLALVGTVFLVLTIYAGVLWMTASGNEEQVTKAVGIIKASVIGLIIIMSAYAITYFVTSKLGEVAGTPQTGQPGVKGCCPTSDYSGCEGGRFQSDCPNLWYAGSCTADCKP
ncbi:MAG: Uncharacterized protein G01um101413_946 [Parcubacteria group bacterium Gr01-1014_13]|nr:MAG: Uncharacterized protein G01um101413_946 [Parcubacteria group bacterium Gr01-1014_13]